VAADGQAGAELASGLDEIVREGARRMLAMALEAEVDAYIATLAGELHDHGHRSVVRNGHSVPAAWGPERGPSRWLPRVNDGWLDVAGG